MSSELPQKNLYGKYGNPYSVAEFRLFSFNKCKSRCQNCFYQKTKNNYYDFENPYLLALDLQKNNYHLETLYLLPTDIFENTDNYKVVADVDFQKSAQLFDYIGIASTLQHGFDLSFFEQFWKYLPLQNIELHLNLIENLLTDSNYVDFIEKQIRDLKSQFGDKILINLALNVGTTFGEGQLQYLSQVISRLSEDQIVELNFTFMFNDQFSFDKKRDMLISGFPLVQYFSAKYGQNENPFNERTALRKPSFTFKDEGIYLSPILPFDEYVFLNEAKYKLDSPEFNSFLKTYTALEKINTPILKHCESCDFLKACLGKQYFSLAQDMKLPCFKGYKDSLIN